MTFTGVVGWLSSKCPAGSVWKSSDAGGQCEECSKGTYQTVGSSSQCMPCPAGHFQDGTGQVNCTSCPVDTYQESSGQPACIPCPEGEVQPVPGSTACRECPAGEFQIHDTQRAGQRICSVCQPGSYQDQPAQVSCKTCPDGTSTSNAASKHLDDCTASPNASYTVAVVMTYTLTVECTDEKANEVKLAIVTQIRDHKGALSDVCLGVTCSNAVVNAWCHQVHSIESKVEFMYLTKYEIESSNDTADINMTSFEEKLQDKINESQIFQTISVAHATLDSLSVEKPREGVCGPGFQYSSLLNACEGYPPGWEWKSNDDGGQYECPKGTYQTMEDNPQCMPCLAGHFQDQTGQVNCTSCPVDTYQESSGQPACIPCPEGEVQPVPGSTACRECPAGEFQIHDTQRAGQRICSVCQPGSYQDQPAQVSCKTCPDGKSTSNAASKHLDDCTASPNASYTVAVVMTYTLTVECTDEKANEVKLAIVTQIRDHKGALSDVCLGVTCSNAVVNAWCHQVHSIESKVEFMYLTSGEMQSSNDTADINMTSVEEKLQDKINESQIFQTISVAYATLDSLSVEKRVEGVCGPGFQFSSLLNACAKCPAGSVWKSSDAGGQCEECSKGTYQTMGSSSQCMPCPAGHFQDQTGQVNCTVCPAGHFQDQTGQVSCASCTVGHFQDRTGQVSCSACPAGYFQNRTGQLSCTSCPVGYFQNQTGHNICTSCPAGHFQNQTGQLSCIMCPAGHFQDRTGQVSCNSCPAGQVQAQNGQVSCTSCPKGHFQNQTGQVSCTSCPVGHSQDKTGQVSCTSCPAGHFQNRTGQVSCTSCPVGHSQDKTGQVTCIICPVGQFQDRTGQVSCTSCPPGHFQNRTGQVRCTSCPVGHSQDKTGQVTCIICPVGQFQDRTGQVSCTSCPAGQVQDQTGQVSCNLCPNGHFQEQTEQVSCTTCPAGHFQDRVGQATCNSCPPGHFQNRTGQVRCTSCPPGHFQNRTGQVNCTSCPVDTYQESSGQPACITCPEGEVQPVPGSTACRECPAGEFQTHDTQRAGQRICSVCQPGSYQDQPAQVSCKTCPDGTSTSNAAAKHLDDCTASPNASYTVAVVMTYTLTVECTDEKANEVKLAIVTQIRDHKGALSDVCLGVTCSNAVVNAWCHQVHSIESKVEFMYLTKYEIESSNDTADINMTSFEEKLQDKINESQIFQTISVAYATLDSLSVEKPRVVCGPGFQYSSLLNACEAMDTPEQKVGVIVGCVIAFIAVLFLSIILFKLSRRFYPAHQLLGKGDKVIFPESQAQEMKSVSGEMLEEIPGEKIEGDHYEHIKEPESVHYDIVAST